ncbi:MAG: AsmA family protein [Gammaproteobacteria bacterium]
MLNFLVRALIGVAVLMVALVAGAYVVLQDPNRFKPEIEEFVAEQTGAQVDIGTDLHWVLFPPLGLSAKEVKADYEGNSYALASLRLDLDLMSVLRTRDIDQWQVTALTLDDLVVTQAGTVTHIESFRIDNFKPKTPSPFKAVLTQRSGEEPPLPLEVNGLINVDPTANQASLTDTRFGTTAASGVCNLDATMTDSSQPPDPADALIPVSIWRTVNWSGACTLDRLTLLEEDFHQATVSLSNTGGKSTTEVRIPEFFEGSAGATVDIDASSDPVRWRIVPDLARADSTAVMAWLDQRLKWIAPLAYSGEITMTGNTTEELVHSVKGKTTFDGGQGKIDIAQIKQPLLKLATLFQEPERVAAWPDLWSYERLVGDWVINGTNHQMDFALDNLTAAAKGDYDLLTDALDMNVEFLFEDNPDMHSFDVNPVLSGYPFP